MTHFNRKRTPNSASFCSWFFFSFLNRLDLISWNSSSHMIIIRCLHNLNPGPKQRWKKKKADIKMRRLIINKNADDPDQMILKIVAIKWTGQWNWNWSQTSTGKKKEWISWRKKDTTQMCFMINLFFFSLVFSEKRLHFLTFVYLVFDVSFVSFRWCCRPRNI